MRRKTVDNLPAEAQAELRAYVERSYPLGRIGRPDDLAGMAVYLASDEAACSSLGGRGKLAPGNTGDGQ